MRGRERGESKGEGGSGVSERELKQKKQRKGE